MMNNGTLSDDEMALVGKLCRPEPFKPTQAEIAALEGLKRERMVRVHGDGSIEVTRRGAEFYLVTKYGA